jgi:DNA-binding PucR family transcriptional regulator
VLIDYDKSHKAELVETLATYLESSGGLEATAARLHIHPSTLKYRLRRIQDLTGRDLRDAEHRFNLDLACRAHAARSVLSESHGNSNA